MSILHLLVATQSLGGSPEDLVSHDPAALFAIGLVVLFIGATLWFGRPNRGA